jgi:prepilin-type N-terminal cleavage/methylation domain-containing protein
MKKKNGFTLIELLVVISIIALLLSIILPALQKAKDQAGKVICASHLHQQGIAVQAYAASFTKYPTPIQPGWFPFGGLGWNESEASRVLTGRSSGKNVWVPAGQASLFVSDFIKDPHFFFCPTAKDGAYGFPLTYKRFWESYYNTTTKPLFDSGVKRWGIDGPYGGYCYWAGYKTTSAAYNTVLDKSIAKDAMSRSRTIIMTDPTTTEKPMTSGQPLSELYKYPFFATHVRSNKLTGGSSLYNDNSVTWKKIGALLDDREQNQKLYIDGSFWSIYTNRSTGVFFWF